MSKETPNGMIHNNFSVNTTIVGNIIAANAEINGKVNGNLSIQDVLTLKATSNIEGDIATQVLIIEPKAVFNGSCKMQDSKRAGKEGK